MAPARGGAAAGGRGGVGALHAAAVPAHGEAGEDLAEGGDDDEDDARCWWRWSWLGMKV